MGRPKKVAPIDGKTKAAEPLDQVKDFETPTKVQAALPGMENRAIDEIEDAARKYANIRDRRMALNEQEVKLKDLLLGLLKKHQKREYKRDGIEVWIKVEEETVKVKVTETEQDIPPSARKEKKDESISDKADVGRTDRVDEKSTEGSPGAPDESSGEDQEIDKQALQAGSAESEDF